MDKTLTNLQNAVLGIVDIIKKAVAYLKAFIESFNTKIAPDDEAIKDDELIAE